MPPPPHSPVWSPPLCSSRFELAPCYSCSWWTPSVCLGQGRWPPPRQHPLHCPHSESARCLRAERVWRLLGAGNRKRVIYTVGIREGFLEEVMKLQAGRFKGIPWAKTGQLGILGGHHLLPTEICPSNRAWPQACHFRDVCPDFPWCKD